VDAEPDAPGRRAAPRSRTARSTLGVLLVVAGVVLGLTAAGLVRADGGPTVRPDPPAAAAPPSGSATSAAPTDPAPSGAAAEPVASRPARPVRLAADRLDIAAPVLPIDASGGVLLPPGDPRELGWWRGGRRPGAGRGAVLITGHTVSTGGGVFDHLGRLRRGDEVEVTTTAGPRLYRVVRTRYLTIEEFADRAPRLLRRAGAERLVLVTCDGWDGRDYEGSTVVVATPAW
jgi:LPXTG-site transpeptidase (sortase) family protein